MPKPFEIWLIIPIALVGSLAFGAALLVMISRMGGWHRLAERFATNEPPAGQRFFMQSASFGNASYSYCLMIYVSEQGLYLSLMWPFRFGHPPLLIPWREIQEVGRHRYLWMDRIVVEIGSPSLATINLSKKLFAGRDVQAQANQARRTAPRRPTMGS